MDEIIDIGCSDTQWREAFFRHAADSFHGIDFSRWGRLGGWTRNYSVLAIVEKAEIVASIGISRQTFSLAADDRHAGRRSVEGFQLGAVATREDRRARGHARRLMDHVLRMADAEGLPVLLFANPSVVDFYPKFGFRLLPSHHVRFKVENCQGGPSLRRLDASVAADRLLLSEICNLSPAHAGMLSARPDASILLWYLSNGLTSAYVTPDEATIVCVEDDGGESMVLQEWLGAVPENMGSVLATLSPALSGCLEFGFLPPSSWPLPLPDLHEDRLSLAFWRGEELQPGPFCFPHLLRT